MSKNNTISPFQLGTIAFFLGGAQILSGGINAIIRIAGTNAWLVPILSVLISLIPILLIIYIGNYKPELNILDKNIHLFGKIVGNIINAIIALYVFGNLTFEIWALVNFVTIKYLGLSPAYFIGIIVVIPIIYGLIKGFETMVRTIEFSFFQNLLITIVILILLNNYVKIDNIKPFLEDGIMPVLKASLLFSGCNFVPLTMLLIIPKNSVTEQEKYNKYILIFSILSILYYTLALINIIGAIGVYLGSLYVYPEYYVLKEINFIGFLENVENILSLHWIFFLGVNLTMSSYFLMEYFKSIFRKAKEKIANIFITIVVGLSLLLHKYLFANITESMNFTRYKYQYIALFILMIYIIISIIIQIKKRTEHSL